MTRKKDLRVKITPELYTRLKTMQKKLGAGGHLPLSLLAEWAISSGLTVIESNTAPIIASVEATSGSPCAPLGGGVDV